MVQPWPACLSLWTTVPTWSRGATVSHTQDRDCELLNLHPPPPHDLATRLLPSTLSPHFLGPSSPAHSTSVGVGRGHSLTILPGYRLSP